MLQEGIIEIAEEDLHDSDASIKVLNSKKAEKAKEFEKEKNDKKRRDNKN